MIKAGTTVKAKRSINISMGEDEAPLLVIREGDHLVANEDTDAQGFQYFTHLPSQFTNIRLHQDDIG